ncbi:MAG: N-acetylmuramoyl-L-alanine amidase [Bacteroidota bacterium]
MLKKVFFSIAITIVTISLYAANPDFHAISPKKGEGIYALMRKYDLNIHPCNLEKFLELNNLTKNSILRTDKKYKLPIYLYTYNGKSIRSTIEDYNMEKALRIKKYNETRLSKGHRKMSYTTSKILWVPYHEVGCNLNSVKKNNISTEEIDKNTLYVGLFGNKYGKVKVEDLNLKNKVYYVVAGHGGPDPGAMCRSCPKDMCEDEYAYDIALRLARDLMQHGAKVHVIIQDPDDGIRDEQYLKCDYDEKCMGKHTIPRRQKARLVQRSAEINKLYRAYKAKGIKYEDQVAIFLHVDSNNESKQQDVYFYHHKKSKNGKKLVNKIRDTFEQKYKQHQKGRGYKGTVKSRGLYVINYTQPTAVFVELANIRNKTNHRRLLSSENRQALANWLFEGLTK